ncbi:MAG: ABC transporter ATP-binding protein [Pseudomonadota bacterium]
MTTTATAAATTVRRDQPRADVPRLSLENIVFRLGDQTILHGVSLDVMPREVVCLLGPSGCGKTTLLRIAAGIARQTSGVVRVAGAVVADDTRFIPAETRPLGLVFQDLALFPHMRVVDNVAYGVRGRARDAASEALKGVGLGGYERAFPHQLSGGEQQRVALARALLPSPEVVLLDEPFSGLDRGLRDTVREDTLDSLRAHQATAVIVTHDPEEALAIADRIALMRRGEVVQFASPQEVWRAPVDLDAAKVFSSVNAFSGRASHGMVHTAVGSVPVGGQAEGAAVTVAFRPEALKVFGADHGEGTEVTVERRRFFGPHVEITGRVNGSLLALRADPYVAGEGALVRVVPDLRQAIVLPGPKSA